MNSTFGHAMREHFMLRDGITFLNHGSFGATPRVVMQEQLTWMQRFEAQPVEFVKRTLGPALRDAAQQLAPFMGADADDLVFVDNASTGVSTVLHALIPILKAGDELLTSSHVYNAVRMTMKHICAITGAQYVEVDVPLPLQSESDYYDALVRGMTERTRFVMIDHITSPTATVIPIEPIIRECHARDILIMIDGAHAPGMLELDLNTLDADWYTGNFHKWLFAPNGCAFLWSRRNHHELMHPLVPSHNYLNGYTIEFDYVGTRDWSTTLAAPAGLTFIQSLGVESVRQHNHALAVKARELLLSLYPQQIPVPESMLGSMSMILLPVRSDNATALSDTLHDHMWDNHGIEVPFMPWLDRVILRVSAQVYNEFSDYEYLCECLPRVMQHV